MSFNDPLSGPLVFGEQDKDLADLADLSLDPALVDSPAHPAAAQPAADPFASLASEPKAPGAGQMPYATYGQLVTPQAPAAPGAVGAGSAAVTAAAAATAAGTSSLPGGSGHDPFTGLSHNQLDPQQPLQHQQQPLQQQQQPQQQQPQQQAGLPDLLAPDTSTPRLLSPEPVVRSDLPLYVTVSEPVKKEATGMLGMKASHIEYLVTTRSQLPGWSVPEVSVRRRFRDFVALAELLKAKFRGYFVPPRPEKNAVEGQRMSDGFVEERRASLQKYLQKLAAHPVIGPSEELKVFLETSGDLGSSMRWTGMMPASASVLEGTAKFSMQLIGRESKVVDPVAAAQPAARSKDLMRAMKEAAQGMRGGREVPLEELDFRRLREAAEEMREQLGLTSKAAEKLVAKLDTLGATAGDLGLSLFKVAKFEEAEGGALARLTGTMRHSSALIADQKRTAAALVRVSKMMGKVTGRTALELGALHDTLATMPAAIRGLMSREHQMLTWHTLQGDLEAKQKALAETDQTKVRKVDDLRGDISRLELSVGAAKAEYDKLKAANLSETARFAAERRAEYVQMLENFTATQVAASERLAEVWVQLAGELGAGPEQLAAVRTETRGLLMTAAAPPAIL